MALSLAADRTDVVKTETTEVLTCLREAIARIEAGEWSPNRLVMIMAENDLDTFNFEVLYRVRALEALGLLDVCRDKIRSDMDPWP